MVRTVAEGLVSALWNAFTTPFTAAPRSDASSVFCESLESRQFLSAGSVNTWTEIVASGARDADVAASRVIESARRTSAATKSPRIVLSAKTASATKVKLSWRQPQLKAKRVIVYAKDSASVLWTRVGMVSAAKTGFIATNLTPGTTHYFQVIAASAKGALQVSKIAAAVTRPAIAPQVSTGVGQPIVITQGGVYSGVFGSNNPDVAAVTIATSEPVVIENSIISSRGHLIESNYYNANLTVRNTKGYALNPNVRGYIPGRFIKLEGFDSLTAENNYMEGTSGIYLYKYYGNYTEQQTIKVRRNVARNIDGRYSNGYGGFMTGYDDFYNVCFFQTNGIQGLPGIEVSWNQIINEPGNSRVEDNINIFNTSGTPGSPVRIHNNYIQGAYAYSPASDSTYTGGGIMLSDVDTAYVHAYDNQVIATTNYGIGISSGHDNQFYNNRIISAGVLPNGLEPAAQNVGGWIWNMNGEWTFSGNVGYNNLIGWNKDGGRRDWWTPDAAMWSGNVAYPGEVTLVTEANEYQIWAQKLIAAQVPIGPSF